MEKKNKKGVLSLKNFKFSSKILLSLVLVISFIGFNNVPGVQNSAHACYPAYKCYTWNLPSTYKLVYSNKDRRLGAYASGVAIGAAGFIPLPGAGIASFAAGSAYAYKETFNANLSYKVYIMKSPVKGKTQRIKTIYYKNTNFSGATTTKVIDR